MAKRKHYFVIVFAFCFLLVFWGYRVWKINKEAVIIPQEEYAKGEWVNLDACKIEQYAVMTGYEIKVEDTSRMNVEEYLKKYASGEEIKEYWQKVENHLTVEPDEIFMVHVKVRNTSTVSDNTNGLNWLWMYLIDKDKSLDMNAVLYPYANRNAGGSVSFALRPQTEMDFYLPYTVLYRYIDKDEIDEIPFKMMLSKFPVMKFVQV